MKARMTRHANTRMKHRCNTGKGAGKKLATSALRYGVTYGEGSDELNHHLAKIFHGGTEKSRCKTGNLRAYGDRVFVFSGNILVTVLPLPDEFIPQVKALTVAKKPPRPPKEKLNVRETHCPHS